ncbi:TonB-dependent receptor plug domain-containing protein [Duganella radicis]|uniref:TonB-dependent receptor plug domain-containing protein n=1 Tax=Duganella radicis TaxID=551988 RepID=A0A6L6PL26_9BURK|nr:TonB-dependent receptor [Duganella radicis]MTV39311.1 TonB-dependent receptor plug domain-containing protein [Duganella radicis]
MTLLFSRRCLIALAVMTCYPLSATASPEDEDLSLYGMDRFAISLATGSTQTLRRAPAVASVITAEDIAAMGATDLDHVLESVAGVHVTRAAPMHAPNYIIRGIGGGGPTNPQVLVLLNGLRLNTDYNGDKGNMWVSMPLTNVARIEIIRGPGSALYGADAFAGVINIITKTAEQMPGLRVGARAGSFDAREAWLEYGHKQDQLAIAAYLQVGRTDGSDRTVQSDAQTLNDSRFGTHVSKAPGEINAGYNAFDGGLDLAWQRWRWRTNLKWRSDVGTGVGVNSALDPDHKARSGSALSELSWNAPDLSDVWSVGASLSYMFFTEQTPDGLGLFPAGARIGPNLFPNGMIGGPNRWERNLRGAVFASYSGWRGHAIRMGAGHDDLYLYQVSTLKNFLLTPAGVPVPTGPVIDYGAIQPHIRPQRRKIDYLYVQDEWQFAPDWALTAGVRHDDYSDFGGTTNPRLALVWDADLNVTVKLLHGRAFRSPSFNEQTGINPVNMGNPRIRPETIATTEAALAWQARPDLAVNLSLYRYAMKDLIRSMANTAPAPGATYQNSGSVDGKGGEIELTWDVNQDLRWLANYARQHAHDPATGKDPGYAPRHHAYTRLDWSFASSWRLGPQLNWVAGRRRAPGDARAPIADYRTVDAVLSHQLPHGWSVSATVRNLFNADAREPSQAPGLALPFDIPVSPRALALQLSVRL